MNFCLTSTGRRALYGDGAPEAHIEAVLVSGSAPYASHDRCQSFTSFHRCGTAQQLLL